MGWQTIPSINITADKWVQATNYIRMLFEYLEIVASKNKGKGNVDLYMRIFANASNALRYGSHSVTCKQHHICLYP